jgi:AraC-like DNA-binding protein
MEFTTLHKSASVAVTSIACRPHSMGQGGLEAQPYRSLAFVRRGAYKFHQGARSVIVEPMSAVFFAADDEYAVSHPFGCGDDCLEFRFPDEVLAEARPALRHSRDAARRINILPIDAEIAWKVQVTARRAEMGLAARLETDENAMSVLARVGAKEAPDRAAETPRCASARSRSKVERAKEILVPDPGRDWSLGELADAAGVSPFHLTRLFRAHTGATLHQYLNRLRLAIALDRVLAGEPDLTALALDLGYSSHSHFSAAFRKHYGCTPSDARLLPSKR